MRSTAARPTGRLLALAGSIVVLTATVTAAGAQEGEFHFEVTLTPESDGAASATCNEFTARVTAGSEVQNPRDQVIVDVRQTLDGAGTEPGEARELSFCAPQDASGANPVTGPTGANAGPSFGGPPTYGDVSGNNQGETAGQPGRNTTVHAEVGPTDQNGEITFGISMTPASASGSVTVFVWVDPTDNDVYDEGEASDTSAKTWTAAAPEAPPTSLDAAPESASLPNGGSHEVTVTLTAGGNPVAGRVPSGVVAPDATGRPAGDVADAGAGGSPNTTAAYTCSASNAQGVSTCTFQDPSGTPAGTDTVVLFLDEGAAGLDAGDPQDAVQVTWFQPQPQPSPPLAATPTPSPAPETPEARNVVLCHGTSVTPSCDTSVKGRGFGEDHSFAVRVSDRDGNSLSGVPVELRETGPAVFAPSGVSTIRVTTGANGVAVVTLTTDVEGTSIVVAEISPPGTPGSFRGPAGDDDECEQPAGTGGAPPAGNCTARALEVLWMTHPFGEICSDGQDNDADGLVDFGEDPGCVDEGDDSELPVNLVHHDRRTNMRFRDSVGPGDEGLVIFGRLRLADEEDAFFECTHRQPMLIQRRVDGEWKTIKEAKTNPTGRWTGVVFDVPVRYRAVAPRVEIQVDDVVHVCSGARKVKTHHHRR